MATVPAQSFCAPARARLIAALRSMPGVCAVLGSSECPGITRTPSCFHFGSLMVASFDFAKLDGLAARAFAHRGAGVAQAIGLLQGRDAFVAQLRDPGVEVGDAERDVVV